MGSWPCELTAGIGGSAGRVIAAGGGSSLLGWLSISGSGSRGRFDDEVEGAELAPKVVLEERRAGTDCRAIEYS